MAYQILDDVKVIEVSHYIAGPYCCKMFADYGADVIKIEKPGKGDGARYLKPFAGDIPHREKSGLFLNLNTNKRSITLNLQSKKGKEIFKKLVKSADVMVESFKPGVMDRLKLGYEILEKINPKLVMTSISNFGQYGPYRDFAMSELTLNAVSGFMASCGLPDREPTKRGENCEEYQSGLTAFVATMGALFTSRFQGEGQYVDCSLMEAMLGTVDNGARDKLSYLYSGMLLVRHDPRISSPTIMPQNILPCKDGFVQWRSDASWWPRYLDMLAGGDTQKRKELDEQFPDLWDLNKLDESWAVCLAWSMDKTKLELMAEAQKYKVPCMMVSTPEDLVENEHFKAINYWLDIEHPVAGKFLYPGLPTRFPQLATKVNQPAPLLGQHTEEILNELGYKNDDITGFKETGII
jgi:crotonobetainyl-CoA:carnitine CoA-transferase CaiB-like acyl-CoA transferase